MVMHLLNRSKLNIAVHFSDTTVTSCNAAPMIAGLIRVVNTEYGYVEYQAPPGFLLPDYTTKNGSSVTVTSLIHGTDNSMTCSYTVKTCNSLA